MSQSDKPPESHVAYGAAMEGLATTAASLAVVGRYWWNMQMRMLIAIGAIGLFKAHWWLFLIVGFVLMAFILPLGLAFFVSAYCALGMGPEAEENYIVPLKQEADSLTSSQGGVFKDVVEEHTADEALELSMLAASIHNMLYLRSVGRDLNDKEFAAASLGALEGTMQARRIRLSDSAMLVQGASFVASQLVSLGRVDKQSVDPEWLAEVTDEAMSSKELNEIRTEAGQLAFVAEGLLVKQSSMA